MLIAAQPCGRVCCAVEIEPIHVDVASCVRLAWSKRASIEVESRGPGLFRPTLRALRGTNVAADHGQAEESLLLLFVSRPRPWNDEAEIVVRIGRVRFDP
jgi:hypothetical protein